MAVFSMLLASCDAPDNHRNLIGTWRGESNQIKNIVLVFKDNNSFELEYVDTDGIARSLTGKYEVDFSKSPLALSLRSIQGLQHPLHTIIEFIDRDTLRMGKFASRWRLRPISFNPQSDIVLQRS